MAKGFGIRIFNYFLIIGLTLISKVSIAAYPNDRVIITDMLDDDIRALIHLLSDEEKRKTIKAIVVSTGNVALKSEVARAIVADMGLNIPVYAGTHTNLADNPTTRFAANLETEGKHILSEKYRKELKALDSWDGNGSAALAKLIKSYSPSNPLDVVCLTAPLDLVKAIESDHAAAKANLGDFFGMGFYKDTGKSIVAPYNTMADPKSVLAFIDHYSDGIFKHLYHVPSDTVQKRSGIPGGYFPENEIGRSYKRAIRGVMERNPALNAIFLSAEEYNLSWVNSAVAQYGIGLTSDSAWVQDSFKAPGEMAGFYVADLIPALLSNMTKEELEKLEFRKRSVASPSVSASIDLKKPFSFREVEDGKVRPFNDLWEIDVKPRLEEHTKLLSNLARVATRSPRTQLINVERELRELSKLKRTFAPDINLKNRGLVLTFKNSPDDWFALQRMISTEMGKNALRNGGIITEGFDPKKVANAISAFLQESGVYDIPIAAGFEYGAKDLDQFRNFDGEVLFKKEGQNLKAFDDLIKKYPPKKDQPITVEKLLKHAFTKSEKQGHLVDLMFLGEGLDTLRYLDKNKADVAKVGSAHVMGGGRIGPDGKFVLTRNWLPHSEEVLDGIDNLAKMKKDIFIFSSQEFGGSLVARTDKPLGNAEVAFKALNNGKEKSLAARAMYEHWENWNRVFAWLFDKNPDKGPFNPIAPLKQLTTSPLGLHIADAWLSGATETRRADWDFKEVSLKTLKEEKVLEARDGARVFWPIQQKGQTGIEVLSEKFSDSIERLITDTDAKSYHEVVRLESVFSKRAREIYERLNSKCRGATTPDCLELDAKKLIKEVCPPL